jgi:hypothetical protein
VRTGPAFLLLLVLLANDRPASPGGSKEGHEEAGERPGRGAYLLRRIFGDLPQSEPSLQGVVPGIRRREIPPGIDLGQEIRSPDSPFSFVKEISGRAAVTFVFDGVGGDARLHHISVTIAQAPNITPKAIVAHLTRIYGSPDPDSPGSREGILGSWQREAVLSRHFPAAGFFEVTLAAPRPLSKPAP